MEQKQKRSQSRWQQCCYVNAESERLDVSASKRKLRRVKDLLKDYEDNFSVDTQSRYVIIDLNMLNDIFNNIGLFDVLLRLRLVAVPS
ncbi:hypothetical protein TNCV_4551391 [Trichonephila clavipes]|nr:hypothetical protein TNCV_4551391 [Trichonephila clavipes]